MSLRYLKFETEAENGMVDERGVLIPGVSTGGSTGSAGGYKYFGIYAGYIYKMDSIKDISEPTNSSPNVTMSEFIDAYEAGPVMMVPVTYHSVDGMKLDKDYNADGNSARKTAYPVIGFEIYCGSPRIDTYYNSDLDVVFAAE